MMVPRCFTSPVSAIVIAAHRSPGAVPSRHHEGCRARSRRALATWRVRSQDRGRDAPRVGSARRSKCCSRTSSAFSNSTKAPLEFRAWRRQASSRPLTVRRRRIPRLGPLRSPTGGLSKFDWLADDGAGHDLGIERGLGILENHLYVPPVLAQLAFAFGIVRLQA